MTAEYIITRESSAVASSNPAKILAPGRVYVTGPHFGRDVFSSSDTIDGADRYTRADAEKYVRERTSWKNPRIEQVPT